MRDRLIFYARKTLKETCCQKSSEGYCHIGTMPRETQATSQGSLLPLAQHCHHPRSRLAELIEISGALFNQPVHRMDGRNAVGRRNNATRRRGAGGDDRRRNEAASDIAGSRRGGY
jgi:hypothetical protein